MALKYQQNLNGENLFLLNMGIQKRCLPCN